MTSFAEAEDKPHQSESMVAIPDLIVIRPVAAVGSVLSTAVFTVTLPFTYHDNNGFDMLHFWVEKPWRFVSDRPLGVWETRESPAIQPIREMENRYSGILGRISADSQLEKIR
jgi:hypothetical protein